MSSNTRRSNSFVYRNKLFRKYSISPPHPPPPLTPQNHSVSDLEVYGRITLCWDTPWHFYKQRRNTNLSWSYQYRSQVCVSRYQFSGYCLKRTEIAPWHRLPRTLTVHSVAEEFRGCHGSRFNFVFTILTSTVFIFRLRSCDRAS